MELDAALGSHTCPDEAALTESARAQPQTEAIVHQHLHPVRTLVDKQIRMMRSRLAEHAHHPCQRRIDTGAHVQWLHGEPGRIDPDHLSTSRSQIAHSCIAE